MLFNYHIELRKTITISLVVACLYSCRSSKNLSGTYRSNLVGKGLLTTTIRLKPDSSFEYIVQGNLIYDSSWGKYLILNRKLFLSTIWEKTGDYKWSMVERTPKIFISGPDTVEYQSLFYFGNRKLFMSDFETGKKITRFNNASYYLEKTNQIE